MPILKATPSNDNTSNCLIRTAFNAFGPLPLGSHKYSYRKKMQVLKLLFHSSKRPMKTYQRSYRAALKTLHFIYYTESEDKQGKQNFKK